ncbi:MAG: ABC transporter permease [Firmicutes bacterium]|nr:ABC transporter permease [Bacillota bacterium]
MSLLVRRNLKLYFRDRGAVFFSLLAVFIIIALYAVFLSDVWLDSYSRDLPGIDFLMNTWIVSGLLAVASLTTTMGAFGVLIDDKVKKIDRDFYASPVKRSRLAQGYLGGALIIGLIMTLLTFALSEIYIVLKGGHWVQPLPALKILGLIFLSTLSNTALLCFIVSFFKTHQSFATASTVIGTLIGFLTGVYLPIGALPESVQMMIKLFPPSHAAALFRQTLMEEPLQTVFEMADQSFVDGFKEFMGLTYFISGHEITPLWSILILVGTSVIFYGLSFWRLSRGGKDRS